MAVFIFGWKKMRVYGFGCKLRVEGVTALQTGGIVNNFEEKRLPATPIRAINEFISKGGRI